MHESTIPTSNYAIRFRPSNVKKVYEDENWTIDIAGDSVRVTYFRDNHFVDERIITKEEMENDTEE